MRTVVSSTTALEVGPTDNRLCSGAEYGQESGTGKMKAAFGTEGDGGGCWRWWGNIVIPAHEWVHTAVSYDGTTEHHYVSGVQVEEQVCGNGGHLIANDDPFLIGRRVHERSGATHSQIQGVNDGTVMQHEEFMGDIDEAMLFNAAITQEQVGYIYSLKYRSKGGRTNVASYPGTADSSRLPASLVGYWPLDGDGSDLGPNGLTGEGLNPLWVAGKFRLALNFKGNDGFMVPVSGALQAINAAVTMAAWVRPTEYEVCGDVGIIMNKESSFEYGIEANSGALQVRQNRLVIAPLLSRLQTDVLGLPWR